MNLDILLLISMELCSHTIFSKIVKYFMSLSWIELQQMQAINHRIADKKERTVLTDWLLSALGYK